MPRAWAKLGILRQAHTRTEPNRREALLLDDAPNAAWVLPLHEIAEKAAPHETVHGLGSIAITYITSAQMMAMLQAKHPGLAEETRREVREMQYRLSGGVADHIREQQDLVDASITERATLSLEASAGGRDYIVDELGFRVPNNPNVEAYCDMRAFADDTFKQATLGVRGVRWSAGVGFALDLMGNDQPYDERHKLLRYLKVEQGLDIRPLEEEDWRPSPPVLVPRDLTMMPANREFGDDLPKAMTFLAPRPFYGTIADN